MTTITTEDPTAVALVRAIHVGDLAALRALVDDEVGLAAVRLGDDDPDGMSRTLLHVVTDWPGHYPNGAETVRLLVAAGADVDGRFRGPHEETALHWAASCDDVEVLDALLDCGADIDAGGAVIGGGTPLADARAFRQWKVAFRLVERGATVDVFAAATLGLVDRLHDIYHTGSPPSEEETDRAFWSACHGGCLAAAQFLYERGADLDGIPPWERLTPLDTAATAGSPELLTWLHSVEARTADQVVPG